ncbi:hypothetical protein [Microbispora bryophytorum]|uniref:Uncharacterized protein n=1 Tax=Microbispora bryophytorum subsp. camponoti TaxID=1677852 RepID=A0ABR8LET9_9ACTN|nr:hypothetical protein [Microbispora camponoti]MBD3148262.1 hypothetical protein [Microbispora camponoti]
MDLLSRIKQINRVKLHQAGYGDLARYANLVPAMPLPIRWDVHCHQLRPGHQVRHRHPHRLY